MSEDNQKFCAKCGATITDPSSFCPECGAPISGSPGDIKLKAEYKQLETEVNNVRVTWAGLIILLYSVPVIIGCIFGIIYIDNVVNGLITNGDFYQWMIENNVSESQVRSYLGYMFYAEIAVGLISVLTAVLCFMRKFWFVAVILCMISAIFGTLYLFGLLLGLLAFWMILSSKPAFDRSIKQ